MLQTTKSTTKRTPKRKSGRVVIDLNAEQEKIAQQVDTILEFLESPINPFLREAVIDSLAQAAQRINSPLLAPVLENGQIMVTANDNPFFQDLHYNLEQLIGMTQLKGFTLRLTAKQRIARAMSELLQNDETPNELFNGVTEFISEGSSGSMKLFWTLPTLEHLLEFVEQTEEITGRQSKSKAKTE